MLISVIIPTFNRANFIGRAIQSVLKQSYKEIEVIVVDDGSSDDTEKIVSTFKEVKYFKIQNSGVSFARNFGVSKSIGEYIAFLDSDDEWIFNKIELQMEYLKLNPEVRIVYTNEKWIRNTEEIQKKRHHEKLFGHIFKNCLEQCFIGPSTILLSKTLFLETGEFDIDYEICEDFELWLRLSYHNYIGIVDQDLVIKYAGHEDQLSMKYPAMDYWRIKALFKFYNSHELCGQNKKLLTSTIEKKTPHLLRGFKKYNRLTEYEEISQILKMLE